jgi:toxin YoeB
MVRRIIWSDKAASFFNSILEYYFQRNGTKTYSSNLNREIKEYIALLKKHPLLGRKTETIHVRVLIKGDLKIFYQIGTDEIIILMIWDTRQDPAKLS